MGNDFPLRCLALSALLFLLERPASGQPTATVGKQHKSVQTSPTTVIDDTVANGIWRFSVAIDGSATGTKSYTPPGGSAQSLPAISGSGEFGLVQYFATLAALNAAFPDGTYGLTFNGQTTSVGLLASTFPNIPVATVSAGTWNNNGVLVVSPGQALTITFNFTTNFTAGHASMDLNVDGQTNGYANEVKSPDLNTSQISMTIPAGTLQNGNLYNVKMDLDNIQTLNTTAVPNWIVGSYFEQETSFVLQASNQGSTLPSFTVNPQSQTVVSGTTVVFLAAATGTPAPSYQWKLGGAALPGATSARLVVSGASGVNAGSYTCVATNTAGSVTSSPATLAITSTANVGRLINLSVNTTAGKSQVLTVGFVTGGAGTAGSENLLIRATGPALSALGVPGTLADPTLSIFNSNSIVVASNDNWGTPATNQTAVTAADTATFAFPLTNPTSLDAALATALAAGPYTAQISGNTAASGTALAEVYDNTPAASYTPATPRLINISAKNQIVAGGSMTAGFVVGGTTSKTVLIRATGPALTLLGVPGAIPDPQIALHTTVNGQDTVLATNAGWGGDPQITAVSNAVFAFPLTNAASADSVVLVTLPPGNYTAVASSVGGAAGTVLIEVYEVL